MATGENIKTWFEGAWADDDLAVIRAADHGAWLGSTVFDGARMFDGVAPDLEAHCARVNRSAEAMGITPTKSTAEIVEIAREGLARYPVGAAVYVRPMYWAVDSGPLALPPGAESRFAMCLEEMPMAAPEDTTTLGATRFRRPTLECAVVNAKAGALYPNNGRMVREARARGFENALVCDATGNVAESASANVFIVRDGVIETPIANGTFLAGITRARHMALLSADGLEVREAVLSWDDVLGADEVFLTGNANKVLPVTQIEDQRFHSGPIARRARALYWDWAHSGPRMTA